MSACDHNWEPDGRCGMGGQWENCLVRAAPWVLQQQPVGTCCALTP